MLYCDCLSVVARLRRIAARPPGCSRPARRLLPAARHPLPVAHRSHLPYTAPVATTHATLAYCCCGALAHFDARQVRTWRASECDRLATVATVA